jgi:uncharacterized membrane protein
MSGPTFLTWRLQKNPPEHWPHPALQKLAREPFPSIARLLAGSELVADKLGFLPARTDPLPLLGRIASGATVGAVFGAIEDRPWWAGAVTGGAAAALGAFAGYHVRRILTKEAGVPDPLVALVEDGIVLGVGQRLVQ